ncbi:hypothetical protein NKI59_17400 [Mesorhizobium sp. M0598]|uniref:hypothetical protein n=1 Tax=Mesorhizobium sp. M0598 TaxID=2956968 RepID=UPI00333B622B
MAATTTALVITGLTPETTEATLICHGLVCQKASNEGSAFGTKYQRKCTCENVNEGANNHPSPRNVNKRPIGGSSGGSGSSGAGNSSGTTG